MESVSQTGLSQNLAAVRDRIARSAEGAGRDPAGITLLAVTKIFPAAAIQEAYELGLREFGENYVQEFEGKAPQVGGLAGARFHLIGHLQSNKAKKAVELFKVIQTVDSAKLARRLNDAVPPAAIPMSAGSTNEGPLEVMLEVNLSGEEAKFGADPAELPAIVEAVRGCHNLRLTGLMTMPPWSDDAEASRPYFRRLRELAEQHGLTGLSMGMSHDLETAIEEGATCVRVGTALFGKRKKV
jgi:pyridoxal phosphate enzyme (YggS family)